MRRNRDREHFQTRLREWQETTLPSHREERIQAALLRAQTELGGRDRSVQGEAKRDHNSHTAFLPLPRALRWRGRWIGASIMGAAAVLLVVTVVTVPRGNHGNNHRAQFGPVSRTASTSSAQSSAASKSTSGGSQSAVAKGSSGGSTQAPANEGAQGSHSHSANGTTGLSAAASWQIPGSITKVEIQMTTASNSNGSPSSRVKSKVVTAPGTIQKLRQSINGLKPVTSLQQGCNGNAGKTAKLIFVTSSGKRVPVQVNDSCGFVAVHGVRLQDTNVWTQLMTITSRSN